MKVTKEYLTKVILQEVSRSKWGIDDAEIDRAPASADDLGPRSAGYIDRTPRNHMPSMYGAEYDKEYNRKQQAYSTAADLNRLRVSIINGLEKVDPKLKQRVVELDKELKQLNSELMKSFDYGDPDDRDSMPIATDETRKISAQIKTKESELEGILAQYSKMGNKVKGTPQTFKDKFKKVFGLKENTVKITKQKLVRIIKEEIMKEMNSDGGHVLTAEQLVSLLRKEYQHIKTSGDIEEAVIGFINDQLRPTDDRKSTQADHNMHRFQVRVSLGEDREGTIFKVSGMFKGLEKEIYEDIYDELGDTQKHQDYVQLMNSISRSSTKSSVTNEY